MDFSELASLVKSIAGIGVLLAAVYLAVQLRNQNRLSQLNKRRSSGLQEGLPMLDPLAGSLDAPMDQLLKARLDGARQGGTEPISEED